MRLLLYYLVYLYSATWPFFISQAQPVLPSHFVRFFFKFSHRLQANPGFLVSIFSIASGVTLQRWSSNFFFLPNFLHLEVLSPFPLLPFLVMIMLQWSVKFYFRDFRFFHNFGFVFYCAFCSILDICCVIRSSALHPVLC